MADPVIIIAADLADGDAERLALGGLTTDEARVVTPRSPYRARGVNGSQLVITHRASRLPGLSELVAEVKACFATVPAFHDPWAGNCRVLGGVEEADPARVCLACDETKENN